MERSKFIMIWNAPIDTTFHISFHKSQYQLGTYLFYATNTEPERSYQICILLSIFGSGCTNWMNCISATTSTTFKCLDTSGQSINLILNMLPKLKNRSVFSGVPSIIKVGYFGSLKNIKKVIYGNLVAWQQQRLATAEGSLLGFCTQSHSYSSTISEQQ